MGVDMISENLENISKTARSILRNEIKHLPLVPSAVIKLLELTNDDNTGLEDLSRLIETEPALAVKILRNVNSAAYGLSDKVLSINRAVTLLGFSAVRQFALDLLFYDNLINSSGINNNTIKNKAAQKFDTLFFWQHCLFVAMLSKKIANALRHPNPDLVYTAGLIHDIGKVVLESYGRMTYSDFISTLNNSENANIENERNFFGLTHTEIGHVFCQEWQLPEPITAVIACHHNQPDETSPFAEFKTEIAIVSFANYVAWMQGISSVPHEGNPILQHAVLKIIDVNQLDMDTLLQQVDRDMQNTREFYDIQFPSVTKLRATLVKTTINLSQVGLNKTYSIDSAANKKSLSSLTVPHHSLNPDEFVPRTLEAIQEEFSFDRCMMLAIDPKHRCLTASYWWPQSIQVQMPQAFKIDINPVSGHLLQCLREKKAAIINDTAAPNKPLLQQLGIAEFMIVPVLNHNRLIGMLYADNLSSKKPLHPQSLSALIPVANELGIALFNAKQYDMQKRCAQLDSLTQMFNKRMIEDFLTQVFKQDKSGLVKTAVGFIDIDKFKLFNDLCGHQAGDDVLKIVADILRSLTRPGDFIGRYGGEEFLFVLKNTDQLGAYGYAERIRIEIERRGKIMSQRFHDHALTVSIGVAMYHQAYSNHMEMIEVADSAMYRAKNEGRNKVIMLTEPPQ